MTSRSNERTRGLTVLGVCCAVLAASAVLPRGGVGVSLCLFRNVTSLPCPSCGMTRAFCALAHGDVPAATAHNLASPLAFSALVAVAALAAAQAATRRDVLRGAWARARRPIVPVTVVAMTAAWIANLSAALGR